MSTNKTPERPRKRVIGPNGAELTLETLPPPDTARWVIRRKAEVVAAIRGGLLTVEEACARYGLSEEEIESWQRMVESHGLPGLRTTRVNLYRNPTGG
jgi:hypothetical protein